MGASILILGESGSGKSSSLRNMPKGAVGVFNVAGKPLPFRGGMDAVSTKKYSYIERTLAANQRRCYVVDDANYLMAFDNFARASESGYQKFTDFAVNFERLLECANGTDADTTVYFMMHPERDERGRIKPKTIGRMLDEKLCVEGMFPIVLEAVNDEAGYSFVTGGAPNSPVKAPMGMFETDRIDNDLALVDAAVRDYWGMAPLDETVKTAGKAAEKKEQA